MELNLSNTVEILGIIGFTAGVLKYIVIDPIQQAMATLKEALEEVKGMLKELGEDQRNIDKRLVAVEESAKQAHKRLDGMEHALQ
ncbi:hypothetical protein [uncultured Anaeromusa sp.]|uniref:hypothetical protein n=1 Tax=uncultured Anaeromusa sp. TaxID=673273 RepID=UPI0029C9504E|nr:hypothetical protein [uncultured Anaeromusa sp.]